MRLTFGYVCYGVACKTGGDCQIVQFADMSLDALNTLVYVCDYLCTFVIHNRPHQPLYGWKNKFQLEWSKPYLTPIKKHISCLDALTLMIAVSFFFYLLLASRMIISNISIEEFFCNIPPRYVVTFTS